MKVIWVLLFTLNGTTTQMGFDSYEFCSVVQERLADQYREAEVTCKKVILKKT